MPGPPPIKKNACIAELRRVAARLGKDTLTVAEFDRYATMSSKTVVSRLKTWGQALRKAGLKWRANQWHETPLPVLAHALVQATVDLGHVPTCTELSRHAGYDRQTLSNRWGGYVPFKRAALAHLLAPETRLAVGPDVRALLEEEQNRITRGAGSDQRRTSVSGGSRKRTPLGLRGFAYAPTNEQGVVALFGAVAHDLGFEILHLQAAYPDCLVRRREAAKKGRQFPPSPSRWGEGAGGWGPTLRIEFEFDSLDFKRHNHDPAGADLVVCWRHTWPACPLPVLELATAIKQLPTSPQRTRSTRRNR